MPRGQFFVLGTIDIDSIEVRQGFTNASAIINVQVFDLSRKIPKRIASIDSVRRDGEGSTEDKAVSNAISAATSLPAIRSSPRSLTDLRYWLMVLEELKTIVVSAWLATVVSFSVFASDVEVISVTGKGFQLTALRRYPRSLRRR